jgi:ATP-dependent Clp protease ATP-binding subunit ClpA
MTSNLGAKEMSALVSSSIGFAPSQAKEAEANLDQKIYHVATEAARRRFSPEFMNRIDKTVVFRSLKREELGQILDLELCAVQRRINEGVGEHFTFRLTDEAKEFLLAEGVDHRYGARHLKRAIERFVVFPLANLSATGQVRSGEVIVAFLDQEQARLAFYLEEIETSLTAAATGSLISGEARSICDQIAA